MTSQTCSYSDSFLPAMFEKILFLACLKANISGTTYPFAVSNIPFESHDFLPFLVKKMVEVSYAL